MKSVDDLPIPKGMILAGVMASEAIDSQGEKLIVRGADITDALEGRMVANYEHRAADQEKIPAAEVVGKVIDAHKVYGEKDCRNALELEAWKRIEMPFIWGVVRLYDAAGHPGAVNLAAQIRDAHAAGDKVAIGFSIEGSTLERGKGNDKHVLEQTVARRVAITFRPCNKTAVFALVADPKAPAGYEKMPGVQGLLPATQKAEPGALVRLGQGYENMYDLETLEKALAAGGYNSAPSALVGGSALQVEDRRRHMKNQVSAAVRDWDKKTPFKKFLKHRLPDVDDGFLDQFADMVHTHTLKKAEVLLAKKLAEKKAKAPKAPKVEKAAKLPVVPDLTVRGEPIKPNAGIKDITDSKFDEENGVLHTPRGSFKFYLPQNDKPEHHAAYHQILKDPEITKYHDFALDNWMKIHHMAKAGKLPDELVAHGALFSELSPNTAVPVQELMYSHAVDAMREGGHDIRKPETLPALGEDWERRGKGLDFPKHSPEHWARLGQAIRIKGKKSTTGRKQGDPQPFSMFPSKFANISKYHTFHAPMVEMINRHMGNARAATRELMEHKVKTQLQEAVRDRAKKAGKEDPGPYMGGPNVAGLAPKTTRYMLGMLGHGNVHVPDTHFARFLFGLEKDKDTSTIDHIKDVLWNERNAPILEGIDRYFAKHHPAVKHLQEHPVHGEYFKNNPEEAIFPAFWKTWMTVIPHEKARGMNTGGYATHTDHKPFFEFANSIMKAEGDAEFGPDEELPKRTARQHAEWVQKYGEMPAMMMYLRYLVPQLLASAHRRAEKKVGELAKVAKWAQEKGLQPRRMGVNPEEEPIQFQGKSIVPGFANRSGKYYQLLGHTPTHWLARDAGDQEWGVKPSKSKVKGPLIQIPRDDDNLTVHSNPFHKDTSSIVDVDRDSIGDLNTRPEQRALVHGMDLNPKTAQAHEGESAQADQSYWHRGANGKRVFVKGGGWGEARNEGAYYNLAHNFFGLGHYLPTVASIRHPQTGAEISVIQHVPGEHWKGHSDRDQAKKDLQTAWDTGDLHKLALMNYVLGNHDRHNGNYLHRKGGGLTMIDHGYALSPDTDIDNGVTPWYLSNHHPSASQEPIHPAAGKWLHGLDPRELEMEMKRTGLRPEVIETSLRRLEHAKMQHARNPNSTLTALKSTPEKSKYPPIS